MAAIFPTAVKTFTTRHDKIDDVQASHVNDLQNEVNAIEVTVGANVQIWSPSFLGTAWNFGTVANRLKVIQNGEHLPVVRLKRDTIPIKNKIETYVGFNRLNDPYGHYNNSDITIKSDGWWVISAYGRYDHLDNGYRLLTLEQNGSIVDRDEDNNINDYGNRESIMSVTWQGLAHIGDRFRVNTYQNSGTTLDFNFVKLHACMLRFYDPSLF